MCARRDSCLTCVGLSFAPDTDRELDDSLAQMETQIFHDEGSYIKETPCGNVIRGFDAFHDRCVHIERGGVVRRVSIRSINTKTQQCRKLNMYAC